MAQDTVTFREARPTREDGLAFARYLDLVSQGFFRLRLPALFMRMSRPLGES